MIQVNLIPDVKQEFLKAQSNKRVIITLSVLVSGAFLAIVVLLWSYVTVIQGTHTSNLDKHISELLVEYQAPEDVSKVLTVDGQLNALPGLHEQKPAMTRLSDYLAKLVPKEITIDNIEIDVVSGTMSIKGLADKTVSIDKFIATLRNAVYYVDPGQSGEQITVSTVFSNTKLERFGTTEKEDATYEIRTSFDPQIFNNSLNLILTVPKTSSDEVEFITPEELTVLKQEATNRKNDLFQEIEEEEEQ
jgi:Tfp pilus assembly protein PilN